MKHLLFDLIDCPPDLLDDEDFVRLSAWTAAKESKSELINISCHKFDPQGVTALAMLAESHLSIHTWPEKGVAKCDIFTCGEKCDPHKAVEYLGKAFKANKIETDAFDRLLSRNLIMNLITRTLILQLKKIANFIVLEEENRESFWFALILTLYVLIGDL